MRVKVVWIAGVELLEFECPRCKARAFAAKKGRELMAACDCGFESTVSDDCNWMRAEIRVPGNGKRKAVRGGKRRRIFARDSFTCQYCHWRPDNLSTGRQLHEKVDGTIRWNWLSVHHIVPVIQGGSEDEENLTTACWSCHRHIGTAYKPPVQRISGE